MARGEIADFGRVGKWKDQISVMTASNVMAEH
jgi:hypothetical protein